MKYELDYTAQLDSTLNGLTLLQRNPEVAIDFRQNSETSNWLFERNNKEVDITWTKLRKATKDEIEDAQFQAADMAILVLDNEETIKVKKNKIIR